MSLRIVSIPQHFYMSVLVSSMQRRLLCSSNRRRRRKNKWRALTLHNIIWRLRTSTWSSFFNLVRIYFFSSRKTNTIVNARILYCKNVCVCVRFYCDWASVSEVLMQRRRREKKCFIKTFYLQIFLRRIPQEM